MLNMNFHLIAIKATTIYAKSALNLYKIYLKGTVQRMNKKIEKKKYFYDEIQDQVIVNFVKQDLTERQKERKQFELNWELNMNFYFGNQYCYISGNNEISDIEKKYYWENREVYNHIAPIIEARLSKLCKIKPNFSVLSKSNNQCKTISSTLEKTILQNSLSDNSFKDVMIAATYWSEITGTSFYKLSWENNMGDIVGESENGYIKNGDVKVSICSPFEIFPDSNGAENIEDCDSIIEVRSLPVRFINEKYNTNFIGEDVDLFELGNTSFLSGISGRSNITKITHSKKHNQALMIERYEKPSVKHPNGKLTIVCKDVLLYDGELPYIIGNNGNRTYPFIKQVSTRQIGCFWGSSIIERCIPIQRTYNAIKNKKHEFIERLASGVLSVEDGSVDIDNLENDGLAPGKILIYRNGSTPPKFLEVNEIPSELENEEQRLIEELSSVSSVSEIMSSSNVPSNINSASALSIIISQDNSRLTLTAENIRSSITIIAKYILRLYKQFANIPRLCNVTNFKGESEMIWWNNENIISDNVYLDSSNELDESASTNKANIINLFEKGFFNDETGHTSAHIKNKILSSLGITNFDSEDDIQKLHKLKALKENKNINNITEASEIDNHLIHINEHTKFLLMEESNFTSEAEKEILLKHIKNHKQKLEEEN